MASSINSPSSPLKLDAQYVAQGYKADPTRVFLAKNETGELERWGFFERDPDASFFTRFQSWFVGDLTKKDPSPYKDTTAGEITDPKDPTKALLAGYNPHPGKENEQAVFADYFKHASEYWKDKEGPPRVITLRNRYKDRAVLIPEEGRAIVEFNDGDQKYYGQYQVFAPCEKGKGTAHGVNGKGKVTAQTLKELQYAVEQWVSTKKRTLQNAQSERAVLEVAGDGSAKATAAKVVKAAQDAGLKGKADAANQQVVVEVGADAEGQRVVVGVNADADDQQEVGVGVGVGAEDQQMVVEVDAGDDKKNFRSEATQTEPIAKAGKPQSKKARAQARADRTKRERLLKKLHVSFKQVSQERQQRNQELKKIRAEHRAVRKEQARLKRSLEETQRSHIAELAALQQQHQVEKQEHLSEYQRLQKEHKATLGEIKEEHGKILNDLYRRHAQEQQNLVQKQQGQLQEHARLLKEALSKHDREQTALQQKHEAENQEQRQKIEQKQKELADQEGQHAAQLRAIEERNKKILEDLERQHAEKQQRLEQTIQQQEQAHKLQIQAIIQQIDANQRQKVELDAQHQQEVEALRQQQAAQQQQLAQQSQALAAQHDQLQDSQQMLEAQREFHDGQQQQFQSMIYLLNSNIQQQQTTIEALHQQLQQMNLRENAQQLQILELKSQIENLNREIQTIQQQGNLRNAQIFGLYLLLITLQNRLDALENHLYALQLHAPALRAQLLDQNGLPTGEEIEGTPIPHGTRPSRKRLQGFSLLPLLPPAENQIIRYQLLPQPAAAAAQPVVNADLAPQAEIILENPPLEDPEDAPAAAVAQPDAAFGWGWLTPIFDLAANVIIDATQIRPLIRKNEAT